MLHVIVEGVVRVVLSLASISRSIGDLHRSSEGSAVGLAQRFLLCVPRSIGKVHFGRGARDYNARMWHLPGLLVQVDGLTHFLGLLFSPSPSLLDCMLLSRHPQRLSYLELAFVKDIGLVPLGPALSTVA